MKRADIVRAYNILCELDRLKAEQAVMLKRLQEIPAELEQREAALRELGL